MNATHTTRRPRSLLTRAQRRELLAAKVADAIAWMRRTGASSTTLAIGGDVGAVTLVVETDRKVWIRLGGITGRSLGCHTDHEAPCTVTGLKGAYLAVV